MAALLRDDNFRRIAQLHIAISVMARHGTVLALFLKVALVLMKGVASMMMRELVSGLLVHREAEPGREDRSRIEGDALEAYITWSNTGSVLVTRKY
ncbi:hypothetical protein I6F07_16550 [Ensifer sp. IC4062]|nr:hypothetical protein [Ensifer sp. IC4062]MCA1441800.1 hypothetical protein [Ensifer sp. IC4062]